MFYVNLARCGHLTCPCKFHGDLKLTWSYTVIYRSTWVAFYSTAFLSPDGFCLQNWVVKILSMLWWCSPSLPSQLPGSSASNASSGEVISTWSKRWTKWVPSQAWSSGWCWDKIQVNKNSDFHVLSFVLAVWLKATLILHSSFPGSLPGAFCIAENNTQVF